MMGYSKAASWAREYRGIFADENARKLPLMNRLTITRRAVFTSRLLMPLLAACGIMTEPPRWTLPHPATVLCASATVPCVKCVLRRHLYARALRQVGYSVELVDTDNSRATALRGLMVPSANSATPTATLPDDEETGSTTPRLNRWTWLSTTAVTCCFT